MTTPYRRRRGGPYLAIAGDLLRHALRRRSWMLLAVILCAVVAAIIAVVGQSTVPYLIYPVL